MSLGTTFTLQAAAAATGAALTSETRRSSGNVTKQITFFDCASGALTAYLPLAAEWSGQMLWLKKTDAALSSVTIKPSTKAKVTETVDDAASTTLDTVGETLCLFSDGSEWHVIERRIPSVSTAWTPTWGKVGGTAPSIGNGTITAYWYRSQRWLVGDISILAGGTTNWGDANGGYSYSLPTGLTIDTTQFPVAGDDTLVDGYMLELDGAVGRAMGRVGYASSTTVKSWSNHVNAASASSVEPVGANAGHHSTFPLTKGSGDRVTVHFRVPITGWKG